MKHITFLIAVLQAINVFAQINTGDIHGKAPFNADFVLADGIYTTHKELLANAPKYPECILHINKKGVFDKLTYTNRFDYTFDYEDTVVFAVVEKGYLFIMYYNKLYTLNIKGAICTFTVVTTYNNNQSAPGGATTVIKPYFADLKSGKIAGIHKSNLKEIIARDQALYASFSKGNHGEKKAYAYILQYNIRNPLYFPIKEVDVDPE